MDPSGNLSQPELLKYLSGEISFETWLDNQQQNDKQQNIECYNNQAEQEASPSYNSAELFSSWGSAFTGNDQQGTSQSLVVDENPDGYNEEYEDHFYQPSVISADPSEDTTTLLTILKEPDYSTVPEASEDDNQIHAFHLQPFIKTLLQLIPTSTVRLNARRKQQDEETEELPDIMKDFHDFQLRKRSKKGAHAIRSKLPELCRLQMGQANLLVAKGDFKQAAEICMEVVREAPNSGTPFKTLAFIYEEQGDSEMSLQYSLISAFLDCKDVHEWKELSKRCMEAGNVKQSLACFDRACKSKPDDIALQWERATLYFENQDFRKALDIYQTVLKLLLATDQVTYIELAKDMAKLYHKHGSIEKAGETLEAAFQGCPLYQDNEGVNMLCEILLSSKKYKKALRVISSHCNIKLPNPSTSASKMKKLHKNMEIQNLQNLNSFINKTLTEDFQDLTSKMAGVASTAGIDLPSSTSLISDMLNPDDKEFIPPQPLPTNPSNTSLNKLDYNVPDDVPLDIRIKLAVCLIHQNQDWLIESIIAPLFTENLETVGDLVLDIAEAFLETGKYQMSLNYLLELVESEKFNQAAVWLKIAECYENLDDNDKTIGSYFQVLSLAPLQASVRLALASALRAKGRNEEAISVLAEYEDACVDDEGDEKIVISEENRLKVEEYEGWYRQCLSMYKEGRLRDFIFHSYVLMYNYLMSGYAHQKKQTITKIHFWEFMLKILNVSVKLKEYKKAINLLEQAMLFKPYAESKKYRLELDYLQTTLYYIAGEYSKSFDSFRILLMHESFANVDGNPIWNLFTQIANKMLDKRHHRFTLRYLFKKPKLIPLIIHNGNNSHLSGTYKYAIGEFSRAFQEWPTYPLNSLLLGISFLHLSCQKFHKTRHTSILHGIIFMFQYFNLREQNQEAYYNLARALHQIGLVHFAVHYYNKALDFPLYNENTDSSPKLVNYHPFIDLHREAAYNLSLIYKASGNTELARKTLYKYCWV